MCVNKTEMTGRNSKKNFEKIVENFLENIGRFLEYWREAWSKSLDNFKKPSY